MKERRCHVSRSSTARAHVRAVAVVRIVLQAVHERLRWLDELGTAALEGRPATCVICAAVKPRWQLRHEEGRRVLVRVLWLRGFCVIPACWMFVGFLP